MLRRCSWLLQTGNLGVSSATTIAPTVPHLLEQVHSKLRNPTPGSRSNSVALISQSQNVYENLALEHSLFNGLRFSESDPSARVVVLYRNTPCVVVGHHQHMLLECQVREAMKRSFQLARRYSGGGTVFHDLGNINICVLSHRKFYRPEENIQMLRSFLVSLCDQALEGRSATLRNVLKDSSTSSRHDLFLEGKKVTGSAMKLGTDVAYHHFTLLVESDVQSMKGILTPKDRLRPAEYPPLPDSATGSPRKMQVGDFVNGFDTLASVSVASVPSPVTTLSDVLLRHGVTKPTLTRESSSHPFRLSEELLRSLGTFAATSFPFGSKTEDARFDTTASREARQLADSNRVFDLPVMEMISVDSDLRQNSSQLRSASWLHKNPQFLTKISVTLPGSNDNGEGKAMDFTVNCSTEFQAGGLCSSIAVEQFPSTDSTLSDILNAVVAVLNAEVGSGNVNPFTMSDQERDSILSRIQCNSGFSFLLVSEEDTIFAKKVGLGLTAAWFNAHKFDISGA